MRTIMHYFSLMFSFLKYNIQSGLEYPAYLFSWLISNPLQFLLGLYMIRVVVQNFSMLGGWTYEEIAFLYGLSIVSHGLAVVFFIQTWQMDLYVTRGRFDMYLIRPLNVFFQFSFQYFNFVGFTDIIPGLLILIYSIQNLDIQFTIRSVIDIIVATIGATFIRGAMYTVIGALAFWIKRSSKLISINLLIDEQVMRYPLNIYPKIIQFILTFILPFGFIGFYPAEYILNLESDELFPGNVCLWTLCVGIVLFLISIFVFYKGMQRYESSGS